MTILEQLSAPGSFDPAALPEQTLYQLFKAYQRAIDTNMICSFTDRTGTIIHANDRFCEVSGYRRDELVGQNHRIINSGLHSKEFFAGLWQKITAGEVWEGELRNKTRNGSFYWVDTVILPVFNSEGKIVQYFSIRYLINEKKRAEENSQLYTKALEELLDMTSHQVRKPIATCLGILGLFENTEREISPEKIKMLVSHLMPSAKELDHFTRELTDRIYLARKRYNQSPPGKIVTAE